MRDAFINYLVKEGHEDPNLVLLSGDLGFGAFDVFRRLGEADPDGGSRSGDDNGLCGDL